MKLSVDKLLSFTLAFILLTVSFAPITGTALGNLPSSWAVDSVEKATSLGLATDDLTNGYQAPTTRAEFCRAAVNLLRKYGHEFDETAPQMFDDTDDYEIGVTAALGIVAGTGNNNFTPNNPLTRQEAATLLRNVLNVLGIDTALPSVILWSDTKDIASWAQSAVDVMYGAKIMSGTSSSELLFSPKTPYTHEQSIITLLNLWQYVGGDEMSSEADSNETIDYDDSYYDDTLLDDDEIEEAVG
ncbi:hypothetical protein FACS1894208_12520 [Clostridia bacterium]|nr:hypothetical protein FACS1894208_12520 [Clostridia bacterium]